jgi:hypothetical protein
MRRWPSEPLHAKGTVSWNMRCYSALNTTVGGVAAASVAVVVGADAARREAALEVVRADGFEFVEFQLHGAVRKRKPGWVATTPGAVLEVAFNGSFGAAADASASSRGTIVELAYLRSYEHMGRAQVECASGCTCRHGAGEVDALSRDARVSLTFLHYMIVTPAERCVLRVTVQNATSSGEHKFKVISLVAKAQTHLAIPADWGQLA